MTSGFGINVDWGWDKSEIPKGHTMPFMRALPSATEGLLISAVFPRWFISLTKRGRQALHGHDEMEVGHFNTLHQWHDLKL